AGESSGGGAGAGRVGPGGAAISKKMRGGAVEAPPTDEDVRGHDARHGPRVRDWVDRGKTDLLASLAHSVKVFLQPAENYRVVRITKWKALYDFLNDLPPDLAEGVRKSLRQRGYDVPPVGKKKGGRPRGTARSPTRTR